jgi:hypothetical protein
MGYIGQTPTAVPLDGDDLADNIITSAKIADGAIVNADINASAAIVGTKLTALAGNVAFPATQSASADANTLDDYEEGNWTPTNSNAFTSASGTYVKIGRMVFCQFTATANSTTTGDCGGLPFTVGSQHGAGPIGYHTINTSEVYNITYDAGTTVFNLRLGSSQVQITSGKLIRASVCYQI